jgi:Subtilase family
MTTTRTIFYTLSVLSTQLFVSNVQAQSFTEMSSTSTLSTPITTPKLPPTQSWMSPDVGSAWNAGYSGKGATISIVDDFSNSSKFSGNINGTVQNQGHGYWTSEQAGLIAYSATMNRLDFNTNTNAVVPLAKTGLNVINASFGMYASPAYINATFNFGTLVNSMVSDAKNGQAVIVKAAGNDSIPIGAVNRSGQFDALNKALTGTPSTIFAGALSTNGTPTAKASMAYYSDSAGTNTSVQSHFLSVGVNTNLMGIAGTSFAAPILSGYAAIVGSKFTTASPTQITNQLLNTARTDTLQNYSASVYGKGEASLSRALAPVSLK